MATRIRIINGKTVALCAAKSSHQKGDLYLNDVVDHTLRIKFIEDYKKEGLIQQSGKKPSITLAFTRKVNALKNHLIEIDKWVEEYLKSGKKPEIDEKWIEEKAKKVWMQFLKQILQIDKFEDFSGTIRFDFTGVKNLIRQIVAEVRSPK